MALPRALRGGGVGAPPGWMRASQWKGGLPNPLRQWRGGTWVLGWCACHHATRARRGAAAMVSSTTQLMWVEPPWHPLSSQEHHGGEVSVQQGVGRDASWRSLMPHRGRGDVVQRARAQAAHTHPPPHTHTQTRSEHARTHTWACPRVGHERGRLCMPATAGLPGGRGDAPCACLHACMHSWGWPDGRCCGAGVQASMRRCTAARSAAARCHPYGHCCMHAWVPQQHTHVARATRANAHRSPPRRGPGQADGPRHPA